MPSRLHFLARFPVKGFLLSCLFHVAVLAFLFWPHQPDMLQQQHRELVLELREEPAEELSEQEKEADGSSELDLASSSRDAADRSLQEDTEGELPEYFDFGLDSEQQILPGKMDSEQEERILRRVREEIDDLWRDSRPPGPGFVQLRIRLDSEGEIASLRIIGLQGSSEVADYIKDLVREAAPYTSAMEGAEQEMVFDCLFDIESAEG